MKGYELYQSIFGFLIPEFSLFMLKAPQTFKVENSSVLHS